MSKDTDQSKQSLIHDVSGCSFSKEDVENRTSDYICWNCGTQFLSKKQREEEGVVTAHLSKCGLCGENKTVTHYRHWNWLNIR